MLSSVSKAMTVGLDSSLRQYRTEQAYIRAVPPAAVFSNALLKRIVASKPSTLTALCKLRGIGQTRQLHYGRDIVRLVNLQARKGRCAQPKLPNHCANAARGAKSTKRKAVKGKKQTKTVAPKIVSSSIVPAEAGKVALINHEPIKVSRFFAGKQGLKTQLSKLPSRPPCCKPAKTSVYVLELEGGRVYVGSSKDVPRRLAAHCGGYGSAYTKVYKPTGVLLPRLGNVEGDGDAAERDETLRYMMLRGVPYVRGWKFARVDMPSEEFEEAEANIRELYDLCRKCGYKGHFCTHCRATFDRLGRPVVR
jgi:predicted GIY-YIG superfamily endonuclease